MDLRKKKTLRAIRNAFLQLRASKPLEKISVRELSDLAEISKATFYLHYKDIYDLSEQLQQEVVTNIFNSISMPEEIATNPANFTRNLFLAFLSHKTLTDILFSGSQEPLLPKSIEAQIRKYLLQEHPNFKDNVALNILLTYQVQGSYNAYRENISTFSGSEIFQVLSIAADAIHIAIQPSMPASMDFISSSTGITPPKSVSYPTKNNPL